mgnify:FL=1|jgi:hypothetical protein|nr:MAG TPA: hypothetical protein [Caudoviricetes sp.]
MSKLNDYFEKTIGLPIIYHDYETYDWNSAKFGTIVVDPKDNNIGIKLKYNVDNQDSKDPFSKYGPSWVALKLPASESLIVEESSRMVCEKIIFIDYDRIEGKLYYSINGVYKESKLTRQDNFVFELDKGEYIPGNHHIKALINNAIECSPVTKTLKELDSTHFVLNSTQLEQGCEIDVYYIERYHVGNPVPRFYNQEEEPVNPEPGDFWINSKRSEHMKQKLPITPYIRYDYNSMQLSVLLKSISNSTFKIYKGENLAATKTSNRSWTTIKVPLAYNEIYTLRIVGENNDYLTNEVTRDIHSTSKVNIALQNLSLTKDKINLHLVGEPDLKFTVYSTADTSNVRFVPDDLNNAYDVSFDRKNKSYYVDITAHKQGKLSFNLERILIEAKDPVEIPIRIVSKEYMVPNTYSQIAKLFVRTTYNKELTLITASNNPENLRYITSNNGEEDGKTYYDYQYNVTLSNNMQYVSFMASDTRENAVSTVVTTSIQPKRTKEIRAHLELSNEPIKVIAGVKYQKLNLIVPNSVPSVQIIPKIYNTRTQGRVRLIKQVGNTYTYLVPVYDQILDHIGTDPNNPWETKSDVMFELSAYAYIDQTLEFPSSYLDHL